MDPHDSSTDVGAGYPARAGFRGLGVMSAVLAFALAGLTDGVLAVAHCHARTFSVTEGVRILFVSTAVCATVGVAVGVLLEACLWVSWRVPALHGLWTLARGGRHGWFVPDPALAAQVLGFFTVTAGLLVAEFAFATYVTARIHAPILVSAALAVGTALPVLPASTASAVLTARFRHVLQRRPTLASPGAALLACAGLSIAVGMVLVAAGWASLRTLSWPLLGFLAGIFVTIVLALCLVLQHPERGRRATPVVLAVMLVALFAGFFSARFAGAWPTVASTVATRTTLARWCVPWLRGLSVPDPREASPPPSPVADVGALAAFPPPSPTNVPVAAGTMSFVVLSFDALRADHVGVYGAPAGATPALDDFALGAARFVHAYTPSPTTLRAFASVWTGRYSSELAWVDDPVYHTLRSPVATVAEALHARGYATAMFADTDYFRNSGALLDGFATREVGSVFKDDANLTTAQAARWIRAQGTAAGPFLAWVHLMGPHQPYRAIAGAPGGGTEMARYDHEVTAADNAARAVLAAANEVSAHGALTVVVMSDHGEAFGEHGHNGHATALYEEEVRVPLLVRAPGVVPGPREALASLVDVAPTMLEAAGIASTVPLSGRSLRAPLRDADIPITGGMWRAAIHIELPADGWISWNQVAEIRPPWALLRDEGHDAWELYDLAHDPVERDDVFSQQPGISDTIVPQLLAWSMGHRRPRARSYASPPQVAQTRVPVAMSAPQ